MLELRKIRAEDEAKFLAAWREIESDQPGSGFAFHFDEKMPFAEYAAWVDDWSRGIRLPQHFVPDTFLVAWVGNEIVGRVSIRHVLNDFLAQVGGHIGYMVVPSQRRKGFATEILRQSLPLARALGIDRALLTCDADNVGSFRTIEKNGGKLEGFTSVASSGVRKRRYWIELGGQSSAR